MTRAGRILVVDDEVNARTALVELLRDEGFDIETAAEGVDALAKQASFDPDIVITDLKMPGMGGLELLAKLRTLADPPAVLVVTAFGAVDTAVQAMRSGAVNYLAKPIDFEALLVLLDRTLQMQSLRRDARQLRQRARERFDPGRLIGNSPSMQHVRELVEQVAPSRATVLITGESGTGKELVANAIHQRSPRANGPFVKLHCAGLAESLLESELFGHERGSFTGASARKEGRFELANGGTLFLDEVGEVSPVLQVKLLRFLQDHEFERVGGTQTIHVDVRVIAATHRKLHEAVAKGSFREDLYYRLSVVTIDIPALRERRDDIPVLARSFQDRYARETGKLVDSISPEALELLTAYDWPGNVRELENAIEHAVVLETHHKLGSENLPSEVQRSSATRLPGIPGSTMAAFERYAILETLKATGGSPSKAAEILGISTRTVQYRIHQYNAEPRSSADGARKRERVAATKRAHANG